jgi:ATP-dependent helicase YprA (DUF1998 family)
MVASSAPIDQFVARHPSFFFDASPEHALVNPDNLHILVDHVKCAAFELPFTTEEATAGQRAGRARRAAGIRAWCIARRRGCEGQWHWTSESYPANAVSLRSVSSDNFVITDHTERPKVIGETDFTSALSTLHPKAIYMVEGKIYQVEELDFVGRKAHVREVDCDYYTTAITYTQGHDPRSLREDAPKWRCTAKCTSCRASSGSRRFVSRPTRTSDRRARICPSSRCTPPRTGSRCPLSIMNALPYSTDDRRDGVIGLAVSR